MGQVMDPLKVLPEGVAQVAAQQGQGRAVLLICSCGVSGGGGVVKKSQQRRGVRRPRSWRAGLG